LICTIVLIGVPALAREKDREDKRLENSGRVLKEILDIPDDIPADLLNKAECVAIFPSVLKFAIGIGGSYGRGVMTCRTGEHYNGRLSAPSMMALEGANIGLQLGGTATDFVLLVMNPRGADAILASKVKLGGDAAAAAGPERAHGTGRHGRYDAGGNSELLSRKRLVCRGVAGRFHTTAPPFGQPKSLWPGHQR
jgi:lipid-binding SYLF domain-containing protein